MADDSVDEQACFRESEGRDILVFTELKLLADLFIASRSLLSTSRDMSRHRTDHTLKKRQGF